MRKPKIIYLFGAGASRPAGIPTINEMTKEFLENPISSIKGINKDSLFLEDENAYRRKFYSLSGICKSHYGSIDLELMMSLLIQLQDVKTRRLFESYGTHEFFRVIKNKRLQNVSYVKDDFIFDLKSKIESYIRQKCENIKSTEYLWILKGLTKEDTLNIFTLNYDGTVEIFCEKNGITYTDGFEPFWDADNFNDKVKLNLYKLHGSLYWLKTESGKSMKIPIKGLSSTNMKYLTDESVYEMMIYPSLEKNKQSIVYSWLYQRFKNELQQSDVCVIIGYSFRDSDITESIVEALSSNKKLWIVIVNPQAQELKQQHFANYQDILERIVIMQMRMEESLEDRYLFPFLRKLENAVNLEGDAWTAQATSQTRLDTQYWKNIILNYLEIGHDDHVKWIVETLLRKNFTDVDEHFPNSVEGKVCVKSLRYAIYYKNANNHEKYEFWKKLFLDSMMTLEYMSFVADDKLKEFSPVKKDEIPKNYRVSGSWYPENIMEQLEKEMTTLIENETRKKIHRCLESLRKTYKLLSRKKSKFDGGYTMYNPEEIVEIYNKENLGLKKWSVAIILNIESMTI